MTLYTASQLDLLISLWKDYRDSRAQGESNKVAMERAIAKSSPIVPLSDYAEVVLAFREDTLNEKEQELAPF